MKPLFNAFCTLPEYPTRRDLTMEPWFQWFGRREPANDKRSGGLKARPYKTAQQPGVQDM